MAYCTQADLVTRIGVARLTEISDPDDTGSPDPTRIADAIAIADSVIDSYIGKRTVVPMPSPTPAIVNVSINWAIRVLRTNSAAGQMMTADVEAQKVDIAWLEGVSRGHATLGVDPEPPHASAQIDKAAPRSSALAISRERLKVFI